MSYKVMDLGVMELEMDNENRYWENDHGLRKNRKANNNNNKRITTLIC